MLGFELSLRCLVIIDKAKTGALSTTKVRPETEEDDASFVRLVHVSELCRKFILGHIWARWMENVQDELTARQETVRDELAGTQCYRY